jgi:hypothetical protein
MKIAIIGGGAAGIMAAATAHEADPRAEIYLLEKNDGLGKKVLISGGGRCNLSTGIRDIQTVLKKYPRGSKFLAKAMHKFSPEDAFAWFEAHGVPLKIEDDMRVFPKSNDGHDVIAVFEKMFRAKSIQVLFKAQVKGIRRENGGFKIDFGDARAPLLVDRVILTTGGQANRQTGSTGDGYGFAVSLGHSLTPLAPSLNAFQTREKWVADLAGVSFERAAFICRLESRISVRDKLHGAQSKDLNPQKGPSLRSGRQEVIGPFIFTHRGLSGPAVFALSSLVAFEDFSAEKPLAISIDFLPDRKLQDVADNIGFHLAKYPKKSLANVLGTLVPKSLAACLCIQLGLDSAAPASGCGKKDAENMANMVKGLVLHVVARAAGDEFVTAGGISLKEVDPSTMESKICPGLYFAGEILDIDGFTGGFNLQSAWATGRLAGQSAVTL